MTFGPRQPGIALDRVVTTEQHLMGFSPLDSCGIESRTYRHLGLFESEPMAVEVHDEMVNLGELSRIEQPGQDLDLRRLDVHLHPYPIVDADVLSHPCGCVDEPAAFWRSELCHPVQHRGVQPAGFVDIHL